eukprot:scaffold5479_cov199-Amphora_coffeaeformis.AAC.22
MDEQSSLLYRFSVAEDDAQARQTQRVDVEEAVGFMGVSYLKSSTDRLESKTEKGIVWCVH